MAVFAHFFSLMSINTTDHCLLKKQRNGLRNLQPVRKYQLHQLRCLLTFSNMFTMPIGPSRIPLGFQSHKWSTKLDDCKAEVLYNDNHGYLAIDWIGLQVVQAINYNTYNFWKKIYTYIYFFMNRRACNSNLLSLHHYTLWQKQNLKNKGNELHLSFNIIILSTHRSNQWVFSVRVLYQYFADQTDSDGREKSLQCLAESQWGELMLRSWRWKEYDYWWFGSWFLT